MFTAVRAWLGASAQITHVCCASCGYWNAIPIDPAGTPWITAATVTMITPTLFVACCARCRTISAMICSTAALIRTTSPSRSIYRWATRAKRGRNSVKQSFLNGRHADYGKSVGNVLSGVRTAHPGNPLRSVEECHGRGTNSARCKIAVLSRRKSPRAATNDCDHTDNFDDLRRGIGWKGGCPGPRMPAPHQHQCSRDLGCISLRRKVPSSKRSSTG